MLALGAKLGWSPIDSTNMEDENAKILDELNVTRARLRHRDRGGSVGDAPDEGLFCSWPTLACFDAPQALWNPKAEEEDASKQ